MDLLEGQTNYQLLGDPGSGKTTTLKRLANILLSQEPTSNDDLCHYPVVVVCRDYNWNSGSVSLCSVLEEILGFPEMKRVSKRNAGKEDSEPRKDERLAQLTRVADFLSGQWVLVLIDGLDEVPVAHRSTLGRDVVALADRLSTGKVVISRRSGDYQNLEGFTVVELCPLESEQVRAIVTSWLGDPQPFLDALRDHPAEDLASRPLFLAQFLILFQHGGHIPEQPASLYKNITDLMLREWDYGRGVVRHSQYADFGIQEKFEFLCALAHDLLISRHLVRFGSNDLELVYKAIAPRFRLPLDDAPLVVQEIESHTGLIVESGTAFEFSHLSLQEYLCAHYLSRKPLARIAARYIREYPEPLAIAVALSSDASATFAEIVTNLGEQGTALVPFARRLARERPRFTSSLELGMAMVAIIEKLTRDDLAIFLPLFADSEVRSAISRLTEKYDRSLETTDATTLFLKNLAGSESEDIKLPRFIRIRSDVYKECGLF